MNCQEVVTLMQRELDHDLDAPEQKLLAEHLNRCPACSEMYERLKLLNEDLEMLPKVMPPFSIVDSILPKLDEIDREQQAATATSFASDHKEQPRDQRTADPLTKTSEGYGIEKPKKGFRFNWKAAGAVAAAAAVFGLIIVNSDLPRTQEAADFSSLANTASETAQNQSAEKAASGSEEKLGAAAEDRSIADSSNQEIEGYSADKSTSTADPKVDDSVANLNQPSERMKDESGSVTEQEVKVPAKEDNGSSADSSRVGPQSIAPVDPTVPPSREGEPVPSKNTNTGSTDSGSQGGSATPDDQPVVDEQEEQVKDTKDLQAEDTKSIFQMVDQVYSLSPDQAFEIIWVEGTLKLYQKEGEASKEVAAIPWKSRPEHISWSEDSKQVRLHFTAADKKVTTWSYEVGQDGFKNRTSVTQEGESVLHHTDPSAEANKDSSVDQDQQNQLPAGQNNK